MMSKSILRHAPWRLLILTLFSTSAAYGQQTSQQPVEELPPNIQEELTPKPELGHRLMDVLSEEAEAVLRKQMLQNSKRPLPNIPREQKQHMFNAMASVSGMSMRELFNFMSHKMKVNEGITFDEVIEAMEIKANEVNFKKVGHSKIWQDIGAISGLPALRLEILHFCDAIVGRRMLDYSPEFVIFIPCRISVMEDATGELWIMTLDWDVSWLSMAWHPDSQLPEDLKKDARRIRDAMEAIMRAGATGEW